MESKKIKSQVTVFIILAILIVIVIALFFIFRSKFLNVGGIDPQVAPIHAYITDCIKQSGEDAVYTVGRTGGYFIAPNLSTSGNIAYYFYENNSFMPSKENIEKELSLYMNNMLFFCIKGFNDFPEFNISSGEIKTVSKIEPGRVKFDVSYKVSISKDTKTYNFEKFSYEVPIRLYSIYNATQKIMQEQMLNKQDICISCLNEFAEEEDLVISMNDYGDKTVVFTLVDNNFKINNESYQFNFANRY